MLETYTEIRKINKEDKSNYVRPEVIAFARCMEDRLRQFDGIKTGWNDLGNYDLENMLHNNFTKLEDFIVDGNKEKAIECALDIANYAMMIVDNLSID